MTNKPSQSASKATPEESAAAKPLCFVVSPIGQPGSPERRHADFVLKGLIRHVLEPLNYEVKRADDDARPGMISDRVIRDVTTAELVVADLTFLNPNVFWELGVRHSAEKATIHIALSGTPLPFDNFGHDTIFFDTTDWDSLETTRRRLGDAAKHTQAADYVVSNPITQSNASFAMRNSEDPKDQIVADLVDKVSRMSARLADMGRQIEQARQPTRSALADYMPHTGVSLISAVPASLANLSPGANLSSEYVQGSIFTPFSPAESYDPNKRRP